MWRFDGLILNITVERNRVSGGWSEIFKIKYFLDLHVTLA